MLIIRTISGRKAKSDLMTFKLELQRQLMTPPVLQFQFHPALMIAMTIPMLNGVQTLLSVRHRTHNLLLDQLGETLSRETCQRWVGIRYGGRRLLTEVDDMFVNTFCDWVHSVTVEVKGKDYPNFSGYDHHEGASCQAGV
jgi:glycopeptide antibiotics resistance protein